MLQKQFPRFSSELSYVTDTTGTTGIFKKVLAREKVLRHNRNANPLPIRLSAVPVPADRYDGYDG